MISTPQSKIQVSMALSPYQRNFLSAADGGYCREPQLVKMLRVGGCGEPSCIQYICNPYT